MPLGGAETKIGEHSPYDSGKEFQLSLSFLCCRPLSASCSCISFSGNFTCTTRYLPTIRLGCQFQMVHQCLKQANWMNKLLNCHTYASTAKSETNSLLWRTQKKKKKRTMRKKKLWFRFLGPDRSNPRFFLVRSVSSRTSHSPPAEVPTAAARSPPLRLRAHRSGSMLAFLRPQRPRRRGGARRPPP